MDNGETTSGSSLGGDAPPNKRLKLTGHRALQISVLPFGHENKWFQPSGHLAGSLAASR